MKYSEANLGRIFVLRLEHGDTIPSTIEDFAKDQGIRSALVYFLGGAEKGSKAVVGPEKGSNEKPIPMITYLSGVSEAVGFGTLFLNQEDCPKLHMHASFGREQSTITGCTREGVTIWHIGEVVMLELLNTSAHRKINTQNGFELLEV
ncbi:MAG: DNA-binding protein [Firmicutes bacterium]|nr:DNA-binding protein [Bacillota bacterium]